LRLPKFVPIIPLSMASLNEITEDSRLLERVRHSDKEAFRSLFDKYQPILFRNVLHSVRDTDTAHDIVQETFVRVWDHRASLKPHLPLLAYLFRISRNLVRDLAKHLAVREKYEAEVPLPGQVENPEESAHARILEEKLDEVVRRHLPAKCREIFLLSRIEGMSNAEISRLLGISVKTVENQITRGLKILRKHLGAYLG
jgi:RNA polymerase sigma-70 factor (ECF subfamily)